MPQCIRTVPAERIWDETKQRFVPKRAPDGSIPQRQCKKYSIPGSPHCSIHATRAERDHAWLIRYVEKYRDKLIEQDALDDLEEPEEDELEPNADNESAR